MTKSHTVIDIFAGPGGLGEGFSAITCRNGDPVYRIGVSAEMEPTAHATLSLRSLKRKCELAGRVANQAYRDVAVELSKSKGLDLQTLAVSAGLSSHWKEVSEEALQLTLGTPDGNRILRSRIKKVVKTRANGLVLIGGPPCQAYSIVGRARNRGVSGYVPAKDKRHFLYQEYLTILRDFEPDVFVMENVKGILSSQIEGNGVFQRLLYDLSRPLGRRPLAYDIVPLAPSVAGGQCPQAAECPSAFIVRSEQFGIPQARHRVVLVGVKRGTASPERLAGTLLSGTSAKHLTIRDALRGLPMLRSGLPGPIDGGRIWRDTMTAQRHRLMKIVATTDKPLARLISQVKFSDALPRRAQTFGKASRRSSEFAKYYQGQHSDPLFNHETRTHMLDDLCRYLYCSTYAMHYKRSPVSTQFPSELQPAHRSWTAGHFSDRFRVQLFDQPGSTITSHLSKDGHHFIHWDPRQCRSLTVREAARVQTFPDDYLFLGPRTQQYVQVGNAVPPTLAQHIARFVQALLS